MWKCTFSVTFLVHKPHLIIYWRMLHGTEVPCVLDYDIKVNIYTICKHMFAEQEQDQGGAATAQIVFDIQDLKRTGDIFGSVNKLATSAEEEKITSGQSENVLGFWPKNCSPKATQKMFCMEFFFLIQSQIGLKYSHYTFFAVVFNGKVRPPKFLTFINSWDQKGCSQMYWGSQPLSMKEHLQSPLKGCSHRRRSQSVKNIFKSWLCFMQGVGLQTSRDHFPT